MVLCHWCRIYPVKRHYGRQAPKQGWRIVDGQTWRWYCGASCASAHRMSKPLYRGNYLKAMEAHKQKARARVLQRLIAACRAVSTPEGLVPIKAMVTVVMHELQTARRREREALYKRVQRQKVRWVA